MSPFLADFVAEVANGKGKLRLALSWTLVAARSVGSDGIEAAALTSQRRYNGT
jgi:hypothetical protein